MSERLSDERAAFEAWYVRRHRIAPVAHPTILAVKPDGRYAHSFVQTQWESWSAACRAGALAMRERAAQACDERTIVYEELEDGASTRYFADKMRGAREGAEACAAAVRAIEL